MNYEILTIPPFEKQLKSLVKKFPSLKAEIAELFNSLSIEPKQGSPLGDNCYKIRLAISSKGKGKSGGARVITNVKVIKSKVYMLAIYDKSEMDAISDDELDSRLKLIPD